MANVRVSWADEVEEYEAAAQRVEGDAHVGGSAQVRDEYPLFVPRSRQILPGMGFEDMDTDTSALEALYRVNTRRLDGEHHAVGATTGTRLHRDAALRASALPDMGEKYGRIEKWWDIVEYNTRTRAVTTAAPLFAGLPYGDHVRGACWTDAHLKAGGPNAHSRWAKALRELDRGHKRFDLADRGLVVYFQPRSGAQHNVEHRLAEVAVQASPEFQVSLFIERGSYNEVTDCYLSCDVLALRQSAPVVADVLVEIIAGFMICLVDGTYQLPSVLMLTSSGLKQMKSQLQRTQYGANLAEVAPTAAHALSSNPVELSDVATGRFVDFCYWRRGAGVHHGRVRAADVPPAGLVLLGANGGLSLSGAVMALRSSTTGAISLITTSAVAGMTFLPIIQDKKHAPCVRDGLMSPIACAALRGSVEGDLSVTVDGVTTKVRSFLSENQSGGRISVNTLDLCGTRSGIEDIAIICGYSVRQGTDHCPHVILTREGFELRVDLNYRFDSGLRWEPLLSLPERIGPVRALGNAYDDSELGIDYGASGIGRYLLRHYTRGGILTSRRIKVDTKGRFSHLTYKEGGKRVIAAPVANIVNYVIDTEYATVKRGTDTLTYVYALGLAKFCGGRYMGSVSVMDTEEHINTFLNTLSEGDRRMHADTVQRLRELNVYEEDMVRVLETVREQLFGKPNVRVYAKGREAEERLMRSSLVGGTRLFRRQAEAAGPVLNELGALLPRFEELARMQGWQQAHEPAHEAVLFGYYAGLATALPEEHLVGADTLHSILPAPGGEHL
uniref:80 kDa protein n=1 Tax=Alphachrysovirus aspergilli TaxID=607716 RepID=A0A679B0I0_9VIRU|nr:80 kDa protein [Alphachrysovirus aspergilli]